MIRNILFDMGNVLMRWDPEHFARRLGYDGADSALLVREVYESRDWQDLDRGTIDDGEMIARVRSRLPERLRAAAEPLVIGWDDEPLQVEGMEPLVSELEGLGYGLYLLTNAGRRHHQYWPKFPVSRFFEGRVMLSADWLLLKPEPEFYKKAFSLFSLNPRECLFIDDRPENVAAAEALGTEGIVFDGDAAALRRKLREKGVEVSL